MSDRAKATVKLATGVCLLASILVPLLMKSSVNRAGTLASDNTKLLTNLWAAQWIAVPETSPFDFGVYHFRRTLELPAKPTSFRVHVTGDNRYQLFVNGRRVVWGPARGDLRHWRYESVDLAAFLRPGNNVLAATVWNFAQYAPEAQITNRSGFLLQGDTEAEAVVNTNSSWKSFHNRAYQPIPFTHAQMRGYFVAGPGERLDAEHYPWGWDGLEFDDSSWQPAAALGPGSPRSVRDGPNGWMLVPRTIPLMEETPQRLSTVRQANGVQVPSGFPQQHASVRIPANTNARLLLDQSYLTTAYPELRLSGGRGAVVSLGYAESLFAPGTGVNKGNRQEVEGKEFVGYYDVFLTDGGTRIFRPLWWRTYRYLEMKIETRNTPLVIEDLQGIYTGYPFERKARFEADTHRLQPILDVGWRTARLCAHETYMDCPYYEQLQYVGDTRIQALVSLYMSGDARLVRNAISLINDSRTAEGSTWSRYPSRLQQYIPSFSLWWIGMVHDYWWYQDDPGFVRNLLPGVRLVLSFFEAHQKTPEALLGLLPWWRYIDWAKEWTEGEPPGEADGNSAPFDLQFLLAYDWAADMEEALGFRPLAQEYHRRASVLRSAVQKYYWDETRQLYADTSAKSHFSQQTNVLAVLAGLVQGEAALRLVERILSDRSLVQCTYYFQHYLHTAVHKVGAGDRYLDLLQPWDAMLARGLTTWAEEEDRPDAAARSDCHAWSAHPNFQIFRIVLGIDSAAPGFRQVLIQPFFGKLTRVSGAIPHPKGEVALRLALQNGRLRAEVTLPPGVTGNFLWKESKQALQAGKNELLF